MPNRAGNAKVTIQGIRRRLNHQDVDDQIRGKFQGVGLCPVRAPRSSPIATDTWICKDKRRLLRILQVGSSDQPTKKWG